VYDSLPDTMIAAAAPEINTQNLMHQLRQRVLANPPSETSSGSPPPPRFGPPPTVHITDFDPARAKRSSQLLENAKAKTQVSRYIPSFLRGLFRRQGAFNGQVLELAKLFAKENSDLKNRVREIVAYLEAQNGWSSGLHQTYNDSRAWEQAVIARTERKRGELLQIQQQFEERLLALSQEVSHLDELQTVEKEIRHDILSLQADVTHTRGALAAEITARRATETTLQLQQERIDTLQAELQHVRNSLQAETTAREGLGDALQAEAKAREGLGEALQAETTAREGVAEALHAEVRAREAINLRIDGDSAWRDTTTAQMEAVREALHKEAHAREIVGERTQSNRESLESIAAVVTQLQTSLEQMNDRYLADTVYLRRELHLHHDSLATGAKHRGAKRTARPPIEEHEFDAFYVRFEDEFRGTRRDIKERLRVYLPYIRKANAGTPALPVLDIGCGRGEWLELLRQQKLSARGVDANSFMIAECKARNLAVEESDAVAYLSSLPPESLGAVTAFHLIEHLPLPAFVRLFREALRVLRSGGICIFETPNPDNVQVGSNRFYSDPTHVRPLPKDYTAFVMKNVGFASVDLLPLHPDQYGFEISGKSSPAERFVHQMFFGEQDYAVIGIK
jgi:SAM-dependent methyltransferase